jgi:hypothetical protein
MLIDKRIVRGNEAQTGFSGCEGPQPSSFSSGRVCLHNIDLGLEGDAPSEPE